ncbi:metallophosphoesterase [Paucisalibacillus sp. EB02]|uniref:metallophosphoesterase n=1 Tax=Paucisalibacillus sp. EB02 TaxID=1347087 RepID=UPI0005A687F1|nr:metallophosphoesterase [Paucisalibacillus sp. EB02]
MIEIQKLKLDKSKRIIVTSDIHGNLNLFKRLLEKVNYTNSDYLFINGDLCEKGTNSLEVIDYVRELVKNNQNVFVTKGNCDVVHRYVFDGNEGILTYMKNRKYSILNEMMALHGKTIDDFTNLTELANFYRANFQDDINWLESLATAYETDHHIIIHAGIDNLVDWYDTSETTALYAKSFQEKEHQSEKTVIVGHWPVVNYRSHQVSSHNPLMDHEKRIISIDGGNRIKKDGQLNALIIDNEEYSSTYVDELQKEVKIVKEHIDHISRIGTVTYPNYEMKIMEREAYFTRCENNNLGTIQWVKNEYLIEEKGQHYCKNDLSVTFLTVHYGEYVKIVDDDCEGFVLVKNISGEVGWIPKECIQK